MIGKVLAAVVGLMASVGLAFAAARGFDDETACAATAFKQYLTSSEKFKHNKKVSDQIEQRRLHEKFCLRFAECVVRGKKSREDSEFSNQFADCLKEEAVELYKLFQE